MHAFYFSIAIRLRRLVYFLLITGVALGDITFDSSNDIYATKDGVSVRRKVILVLVSGFSHYSAEEENRFNLSGFIQLRRHGSSAAYLKPEFPTLSLPNQYSLLTGLHAGKHGISSDVMYDRHTKTYFINGTQDGDFDLRWWNRTEPVWLTAAKQGVPIAMYWWRGCQVPFEDRINVEASIECIPYKDALTTDSLAGHIPAIVRRLSQGLSGFVLINYEMVDLAAHRNGPNSVHVGYYIGRIAGILADLQAAISAAGLWPTTDLLVVSDHGQQAMRSETNVQFVDDFLDDPSIIEASANDGALMMIFPVQGQEYRVYQELHDRIPNVTVFTDKDLQRKTSWHYGAAAHLSPLLLVADPGFGVYRRNRFQSINEFPRSLHGYDNSAPSMRGVFYSRGVDFKTHYVNARIRMVDVYQVICHLLKLRCHKHDGQWNHVSRMFVKRTDALFAQGRSSANLLIGHRLVPSLVMVLFCLLVAHIVLRIACSVC